MRFAFLLIVLTLTGSASAQTCCSGGVPVSANLGLPPAEAKSWQIAMTYDANHLETLLDGKNVLEDSRRQRTTRSLLFELGYSISEKWSADLFFAVVQQLRIIEGNFQEDRASTFGLGDLAFLLKYQLINKKQFQWTLGSGPKLPTGPSALRDEQGLVHVADLQPGSGAIDLLFWSQINSNLSFRPSLTFSLNSVFSQKGKNKEYLGSQVYQFGNEIQLNFAVADRLLIKNLILDPALALRYRKAFTDSINAAEIPNTGGQWIFLEPAVTYWVNPGVNFSTGVSLPVLAEVIGTQLSPTFRWNVAFYKRLNFKKASSIDF